MSKLDELKRLEINQLMRVIDDIHCSGSDVNDHEIDINPAITTMIKYMPALLKVVEEVQEMAIELTHEQRAQWEPYWLEKYDRVIAALRELEGE